MAPARANETADTSVSNGTPSINAPTGKGEPAAAKDCAAVDFATAELVRVKDRVLLKVTGEAPHGGMSVEVRPVLYVMQPDYWQMVLVACVAKGAKAEGPPAPFSVEINMAGNLGRKGIELSGRPGGKPKRLELAD